MLHLRDGDRSGAIHLEEGQPIHAQAGGMRGGDAVRELLGWTDARATWIAGRSASARTILGRVEGLLDREPAGLPRATEDLSDALRDVVEKLERLARTPDILAAYLLRASCRALPRGAVVTAVVDPGVGGDRDALIVDTDGLTLVGPDNGLLSRVDGIRRVHRIEWRPDALSTSFHGRDLFVPVAARIAVAGFRRRGRGCS